ncbi:hypothetical protein KJ742_03570, partial [Patescibacteria group bacterium]|nr:hypothetical protein [Patescibacteria group bacterium]
MKTILITLFTILCFVGYAIAEGSPEYIDSGLKAGDKTIWFGFNMTSENNICIDNDNNEKECLIYCKWCDIALFQDTDDMYMLSLADKGILYQEDEFQVAYYDLSTGKIIGISSDINMFLTKYKAPGNAIVLDDVHWSEFKNEDFNEDKTKIALKLNYYKPDDNEIKNAM